MALPTTVELCIRERFATQAVTVPPTLGYSPFRQKVSSEHLHRTRPVAAVCSKPHGGENGFFSREFKLIKHLLSGFSPQPKVSTHV